MTEAIIIAFIAAAGSVLGQALIAGSSRKKDAAERARLDERTANRLASIERKLDEHNGLAPRLVEIERRLAVLTTEVEALKEQVKELKERN